MAKGKKTGGRNFALGNCANPKGRPQVPEEVRIARQMTHDQLLLIFNKLIYMTKSELKAHWENPLTPVFEVVVCKILNSAECQGDHYRLDFLLNRLIGKVSDKIEHQMPTPFIIKRGDGSEIEMTAKKEIKEDGGKDE